MSLVNWHTENTLDQLFDRDSFFVAKNNHWPTDGDVILPKVNVTEDEKSFHLEAETPGMMENDVTVEVHNGVLTIKGNKENFSETKNGNYRIREFSNRGFERTFKLSERVNTKKVSAKIENGILQVDLPMHEQLKPQKIEVTGVS